MRNVSSGDQEQRESLGPIGRSSRLAPLARSGLDFRSIERTEITRCQSQPHERSVRPRRDRLERGIGAARQHRLTVIQERLGCFSIRDRMTLRRRRRSRPREPRCLRLRSRSNREFQRSRWSSPSEKITMARPSACSSGPKASRAASRAAPRSVPPGRTPPGRSRCNASSTAPRFSVNGQRSTPRPANATTAARLDGSLRQRVHQTLRRLDRRGQAIGHRVLDPHALADVDHQHHVMPRRNRRRRPDVPIAAVPWRQSNRQHTQSTRIVPSRGTRPRCASACQPAPGGAGPGPPRGPDQAGS